MSKKKSSRNDPSQSPETKRGAAIEFTPEAVLAPERTGAAESGDAPEAGSGSLPRPGCAPAPKEKGGKRKAAPGPDTTLAVLAAGYLAHLEASGKSNGTIFSYRLELAVALDELGAETKLAELTSERVLAFFASDRVNKTRSGVLKARVSVLKTQRVLRQALLWAAERGLVEKAPLPEYAAAF